METPVFRIAPEGLPLLLSSAVAGWVFMILGLGFFFSLALLIVFVFMCFFFRDPRRTAAERDKNLILSPSDGRVIEVKTEREELFIGSETTRVSIFLSLFDCHVNWFPVSGEVLASRHVPGKYSFAFGKGASNVNEKLMTHIKPLNGGPEIVMVQVAGFVARRIVSRASQGRSLGPGERFGIIKFGSRVDLFLPSQYKIRVKKGDVLRGAETPVAHLMTFT